MRGTGRPIWDDLASAADLAWLDADTDPLPSTPDVLVIGGGAIGLSIAASCTSFGLDVLLVEREQRLAGAASGRAAGGLAPDAHPELGPEWRAMATHSLALHRELDAHWHYGLRDIDLLVLPDLVIENQAHCDPLRFCAALARHVGAIATSVTEERLRDVHPTHVVRATGVHDTSEARWIKGHLIATAPVEPVLDQMVASVADDVLMIQLESGHIVAGGTKEPGIDDASVDETICARIADVSGTHCGDLDVTHRWTCFRPHLPDDQPFMGRVGDEWIASGFYSTGILMAPYVGETIAKMILDW
jgi:glycine/D-amino acid oxidase-like deaminating enzyme